MSLMNKKSIEDVSFKNQRVLCRVDYNVPVKEGAVQDATRIEETLPTLKYILNQEPKVLILMSHLGRPNGEVKPDCSLKPVAARLEQLIGQKVLFANDCVGDEVEKVIDQQAIEKQEAKIVLLENLRFHKEEETKGASKEQVEQFCNQLAKLGNVYVNDAFGTAHRAHSSMVGLKQLNNCVSGYLLKKELDYFGKVLEKPQKPFLSILGGAKVKDKIKLIENLLDKVDEMMIVGGMSYTFKKVCFNVSIGKSLFDEDGSKIVKDLVEKAKQKNVKLHFPVDYVCASEIKEGVETKVYTDEQGIPDELMGLDIGPKSVENFKKIISEAKTVVWNGPAGVFEVKEFANGSLQILNAVTETTEKSGLISVIGGGDTASLVVNNDAKDKVSHVSTGGGASLELLEGKDLPGVSALSNK